MKASSLFLLFGLISGLVGCSTQSDTPGGQTGDEGTSNGGGCDYEPVIVGRDEVTPLGFSAEQTLDIALGVHKAPFFWKQDGHAYGPESGESELTLEIEEPGEARFMVGKPVESTLQLGAICPNYLEVDVKVRASTRGGALDETFVAPLRGESARVARLVHSFDVEALSGSFEFDPNSLGASTVIAFRLDAAISEYGLSGSLTAQYELKSTDVVSSYGQSLGSFPEESSCSMGEIAVPFDAGPVSSKAALELVDSVGSVELGLKKGDAAQSELSIEHDGSVSCADLLGSFGLEPSGVVSTGAVLHLKTSDGALDHDFPVSVEAIPANDGLLDRVRVMGSCRASAGNFAATCGDYGVDLAGYDVGHVALELTVRPGAEAPEVSGQLRVNGIIRPECLDNPPPCTENGCPGCQGETVEPVATVELR